MRVENAKWMYLGNDPHDQIFTDETPNRRVANVYGGYMDVIFRIIADHNAMVGISDPAAFVAKVRELVDSFDGYGPDDPIDRKPFKCLCELATMLPQETP